MYTILVIPAYKSQGKSRIHGDEYQNGESGDRVEKTSRYFHQVHVLIFLHSGQL